MHRLLRFVSTVGLSVGGMLICVVGLVGVLSVGRAEAKKGGLPLCLDQLADCKTDLNACEAESSAVFPGDGVTGPTLSYTDHGDGTFTDNNTQLVWEKKTATGCPNTDVHCVNNTYTWAGAGAWVAALNVANFAGHNDWRLPNVKELQSIVDYSKPLPSQWFVPATSVPGATGPDLGTYWSSTGAGTGAWYVSFRGLGQGLGRLRRRRVQRR